MHLPDGFLETRVWLSGWGIAVIALGLAIKKVNRALQEKIVPLMGVMAAFIFAAQMVNFPVLGGTSGHLLGAVLAAVLLGPYAAMLVISIVLVVQCLVFQDGGLTALGANILNMAVVGAMGGYGVYRILRNIIKGRRGILAATAVAAWFSVMAAAIFCAGELAISQTSPLKIVLPAMALVHFFIGIGEAVITTLVISFILKVRPDLIYK
jgi:cobalt/nickel transport system permease protein